MTNTDLAFKRALINHAYEKKLISREQFENIMESIKSEEEELRLEEKLKSYKNKEALEKYKEHLLV